MNYMWCCIAALHLILSVYAGPLVTLKHGGQLEGKSITYDGKSADIYLGKWITTQVEKILPNWFFSLDTYRVLVTKSTEIFTQISFKWKFTGNRRIKYCVYCMSDNINWTAKLACSFMHIPDTSTFKIFMY